MTQEVPEWLNSSFLASALKHEAQDKEVSVSAFKSTPAVLAGENYAGNLYRVSVEYRVGDEETKSKSLIVKSPPTQGVIFDLVGDAGLFSVEPTIYREMLPKFRELIHHEFGPHLYYCVDNVMVLEDLKDCGYVKGDNFEKVDFQHCKLVIATLAKYHAASVTYNRENPRFVETVCKEKLFFDGKAFYEGFKPWLENSIEVSIETLNEVDESKVLEEYVRSRCKHVSASTVEVCKPKAKGLNVINHGDLWVNNMLSKHTASGDLEDVKFIDFQVPRFGSPAIDLIYFLWTSADEDVRTGKLQELHEVYLQELNTTLQKLGCKERYSKEELQEDLKFARDWGVYVICAELPLMMSEPDNAIVAEETSTDDYKSKESIRSLQSNKHYRSLLPRILKQYIDWYSTF